jgi:hypothetical protein
MILGKPGQMWAIGALRAPESMLDGPTLRTVRYTPLMKWFRLETRVSVMLMGLPEFAGLLLQNAPQGAIAAGTLDVLRATAAGNPPSI